MCMYHLDQWNKNFQSMCKYLNENASKEQFEKLSRNLCRMEKILTDGTKHLFNRKEAFLYLTLFDRFTKSRSVDQEFGDFLNFWDKTSQQERKRGVRLPDGSGTGDKAAVISRLAMLERRMLEFRKKEEILW